MRYEARVSAYDVMSVIQVSAVVWSTDSLAPGPITEEVRVATTVVGEGEPDPREWLRDALVALLEDL